MRTGKRFSITPASWASRHRGERLGSPYKSGQLRFDLRAKILRAKLSGAKGRGLGAVSGMNDPNGAQFEILVDGKPRSYRDVKAVAIEPPCSSKSAGLRKR